ncbi:uncharacterized protein LOC119387607 [Rhipicephalus sanguineus]|uniref:uncharacterized protein LOC119387607 n=1 Tax=Rhipicephalus sanguineus TaxID=34632 RepID=UPI001893A864|nr:uncharacterized protein LOC119387607 [Rhipicephalus sanguineus]
MIFQMLLATLLLCAHGARALRPYEPLDEDSNSGIPAVHAAPAFGDGKTPQDDVPTQEDDMMENGNTPLTRQQAYHFSYQIRDADGNSQHHSEQSDVRNNRRGSYGYRDANGLYRHVTYVADRKGFRAWIKTNEPGTTNQEPADVRITAEKPPQKVVDEATSPPAKPNVVADPADAVPARPAVSAVPAFTQPEAVPYHPVHTAGVGGYTRRSGRALLSTYRLLERTNFPGQWLQCQPSTSPLAPTRRTTRNGCPALVTFPLTTVARAQFLFMITRGCQRRALPTSSTTRSLRGYKITRTQTEYRATRTLRSLRTPTRLYPTPSLFTSRFASSRH